MSQNKTAPKDGKSAEKKKKDMPLTTSNNYINTRIQSELINEYVEITMRLKML